MNRMTGIILMSSGALIFVIGLLIYTTSKKTTSPLPVAVMIMNPKHNWSITTKNKVTISKNSSYKNLIKSIIV